MSYLERVPYRTDNKKVASARVSEVVMVALSDASKDSDAVHGYSFTISKIIEKALNETLEELKEKTFIDYYKLVVFKRKMEQIQTQLSFDGLTHFFDFEKEVKEFKLGIIANEEMLYGQFEHEGKESVEQSFDVALQKLEHKIIQEWNDNLKEHNIDLTITWDGVVLPPAHPLK